MKKLRLNLDALRVESFQATSDADLRQGTVHGHFSQNNPAGCYKSQVNTCLYTCDDATCLASCNGTCFPYTCACATVACSRDICQDTTTCPPTG